MSASAMQGGHNKFTCTLVILFVLVCCEVEFNDPVAYIQWVQSGTRPCTCCCTRAESSQDS